MVDLGGSRDSMGARKALLERLRELSDEQKKKKQRTGDCAGEDAAHGKAGEATSRFKRRWAAHQVEGDEAKRGRIAVDEGEEQGERTAAELAVVMEQSKKKRRTEEMVEALDEDAEEAEEARRKRKWANGAGAEEEKAKPERAASAKSFCDRSGAAAAMTVEKVAVLR